MKEKLILILVFLASLKDFSQKEYHLDSVNIFSVHKPETLVASPRYSIYDFDFYEDRLILLTADKTLENAKLRLADYSGNILATQALPSEAGAAEGLFHDYESYTDVICDRTVFRLEILAGNFLLMEMNKENFERNIKPVKDSSGKTIYFSNQWNQYPMFNYYSAGLSDTSAKLLASVRNEDLMKIYNMEYYYLPSRSQLEARRLADYYKTDKRIIAALMSRFTGSMYYEPLYAPLFVMNDTVCVFNHYSNHIYHFSAPDKLVDSVQISYHHPKNWREWKKQLFVDKEQDKVYALFSKNGHNYLKQIDHRTGKEVFTYKLKHHSAEKIKIKGGFVYYVYRPFESTQEKFLYREKIE
jgi:hypothetical protein